MRKFKGCISTSVHSSECQFEFEMPDEATEEEIENAAKDAAYDYVDWYFEEID